MNNKDKETVSLDDVIKYSKEYSDFAFELAVASNVRQCDIEVFDQSGIYKDPNTNIPREFDIRARRVLKQDNVLAMQGHALFPIECKNIRDHSPLVVHCIRRDLSKSYQNAIYNPSDHSDAFLSNQQIILWERDGLYSNSCKPWEWVGLSIDQIRKDISGHIKSSDANVYNKIAQATQSGYDLITDACLSTKTEEVVYVVHPVLVIPDDRLFIIKYENEVPLESEHAQYISYYSGYETIVQYNTSEMKFVYSHIDIVEISKLEWYFSQVMHVLGLLISKNDRIRNAYKSNIHNLK